MYNLSLLKITMVSALLGSATLSHAEKNQGLDIGLISETTTVVPGQPFTVGLHIHHHEGYHTYWQNPGSVGLATKIDWKLPEGFTSSDIRWPYPELTKMASHPCHGYERDVTLLVTITPPKTIAAKEVTLTASAGWMCCASKCHPGFKEFTLNLNVGDQTTADPKAKKLIATAQQEIPKVSQAWSASILTGSSDKTIQVKISPPAETPAKDVYLFSCDGQISSDKEQKLKVQPDGSWLLSVERSEFSPENSKRLTSVLKAGGQYILIDPKYSQ
ncbi:protein-disulfide reductase DsbD domain-containing protein [Oceaniferula spumae]